MKLRCLLLCFMSWLGVENFAQPADYTWTTPSKNASESMPCGGGDVGMNVWVEEGDILFYLSRSGCFDENNTLLKLGRFRIHLSQPFRASSFRQVLKLNDGYVLVTDGQKAVEIWADVYKPVVHVDVTIEKEKTDVEVTYESWRTKDITLTKREAFQTSYKFAKPKDLKTICDYVDAAPKVLTFHHHNHEQTIFDATVHQQQMDVVKNRLYNPLKWLTFGGRMQGEGFAYKGKTAGRYASTNYEGWTYASQHPRSSHHLTITLGTLQTSVFDDLHDLLVKTEQSISLKRDRQLTRKWWNDFWKRSFIETPQRSSGTSTNQHFPEIKENQSSSELGTNQPALLFRNYTLFRYMLGCNALSPWPTKFNGGLFTFDPEYVEVAKKSAPDEYSLSPDFRNWGGGVHTAQNQRLVYWPMLKSGDFDLMQAQIDFYLRILGNAEERSRLYWGHEGGCFTEQIENYGLPCFPEYGTKRPEGFDPGMERNAWLEYEWDTVLEFCQMILERMRYEGVRFNPKTNARQQVVEVAFVRSCLRFFDEHYQYLARQRGAKTLDGEGKIVFYPGSGGETFKGAYNSASTVAALRTVTQTLDEMLGGDSLCQAFLQRLPEIPLRTVGGKTMIAPARLWERVQNVESTMLYPVFPWRIYGVGREGLDIARNTYLNDEYALQFRSHVGWKQDNIFAACLGLTDEAARLTALKLADGPHRFPAFWGPGYDWTPDHNWGGSGMIGLQEMLMQEVGDTILLFPAWPEDWDVHFKLHASRNTTIEATLQDGKVNYTVLPEERRKAVRIMLKR